MDNKNIGSRIKERRESLGLTQEELAKKMGYASKSTINKIELGINDVMQSKILAYAAVLECSPAYLLGVESTPTPKTNNKTSVMLEYWSRLNSEQQARALDYINFLSEKRDS